MLPAKRDVNGFTYVIVGVPPAGTEFIAGLAISDKGQLYTSTTATTVFANGLMVSNVGQLVTAASGTPQSYLNGVARLANGAMLASSAAPAATDVFVGGVLVTKDGALCITTANPATDAAFSTGYSNGFS